MGGKVDEHMQELLAEVLYDAGNRVMSWKGLKKHSPDEYEDYMAFAKTIMRDKRLQVLRGRKG
jgi:hypothetical protein